MTTAIYVLVYLMLGLALARIRIAYEWRKTGLGLWEREEVDVLVGYLLIWPILFPILIRDLLRWRKETDA